MSNNIQKPVDYYDRIADALETIAGDDSHVDDESPTMDYYDRIADALEEIAENPPSGGGGGGGNVGIFTVTFTGDNETGYSCNKTLEEITAAYQNNIVKGIYLLGDVTYILYLNSIDDYQAYFTSIQVSYDSVMYNYVVNYMSFIVNGDTVQNAQYQFTQN